jgi:hypothetical protein
MTVRVCLGLRRPHTYDSPFLPPPFLSRLTQWLTLCPIPLLMSLSYSSYAKSPLKMTWRQSMPTSDLQLNLACVDDSSCCATYPSTASPTSLVAPVPYTTPARFVPHQNAGCSSSAPSPFFPSHIRSLSIHVSAQQIVPPFYFFFC